MKYPKLRIRRRSFHDVWWSSDWLVIPIGPIEFVWWKGEHDVTT